MRKIRTITLLLIIFILIAGIFSCSEVDIIETIDNTRISKIKLEESRSFNSHWVIADLDYVDEKLSSIYLNENSQQSNSRLLNQYEYDNKKIIDNGFYKETYTFNNTNLTEWMCENEVDGQFVFLEKKVYDYENNNLISWRHIIEENFPYIYDTLSYDGNKLKNYKSYYSTETAGGHQEKLGREGIYTYQGDVLIYIDKINYYKDTSRYSFTYDGSKILKIDLQYNNSSKVINYLDFSYDELGRIKTIVFKTGVENSYIVASEAKWTFEYEIGKSNVKFDQKTILWKIMRLDIHQFPEKIINDFFTIHPE